MDLPSLVLPVDLREPVRHGAVDLYAPDPAFAPGPGVLIVHGGPLPAQVLPRPREWPVYRAYASLLASRGATAAMLDHRYHVVGSPEDALSDLRHAVDLLRDQPGVDGDRIAVWYFSGGGLLTPHWLSAPPAWLRCVGLSYPVFIPDPAWGPADLPSPAEAVASIGEVPIVLTRAGLEREDWAAAVEDFVAAAAKAGARLEIVDVPDGQHAFDAKDDTDASRAAILRATDLILSYVA